METGDEQRHVSTEIPALAGMTHCLKFTFSVIPAKAGIS